MLARDEPHHQRLNDPVLANRFDEFRERLARKIFSREKSAEKCFRSGKYLVQHCFRQPSRERVLLARVITTQESE